MFEGLTKILCCNENKASSVYLTASYLVDIIIVATRLLNRTKCSINSASLNRSTDQYDFDFLASTGILIRS